MTRQEQERLLQEFRDNCAHYWQIAGTERDSPMVLRVLYVCEKCDSYTYRQTTFVGWQMDTIETRIGLNPATTEDTVALRSRRA